MPDELYPIDPLLRAVLAGCRMAEDSRRRVSLSEERKRISDMVLALKWKHMGDRNRNVVDELRGLEREIRGY